MQTITVAQFNQLLSAQPGTSVLDVRTPVEYAEVHVLQARNLPLDRLRPTDLIAAGEIQKGRAVYLLCRSGVRALKAAELFSRQGFDDSIVVEGGTQAWIEAGLPVQRSAVKVMSLERQVRITAGALVFTGVVLGWLVHPGFYGLAGFVGAGLVFAGITDFCGMGLLLAKLPWNQRLPKNPA